ncbi:ABC transporter ATP-binding protein [Candidatus Woesearchaeota archaeon]|nr:ABC transporter ATP-binding protein [Candidatus Woesearchaeota archaeon]
MKKDKKTVIRIENVWKTYKMGEVEVHALRGMNFLVEKGEFVAIMGPSGSGKSTAVNMVGALDVPSKGEIFLEHRNIAHLSESELAQIRGKKIGFIFQQFNLIPTLTAKENVMLPMIFQGIPLAERKQRAEKLLNMVDLGERMNHRPTELSGGQQQRVAIARSLANDPDVIIADEPTGNLDSKTSKLVVDFLCQLHKKEKKTIIMVTHDIEVAKCAERIERLKDGVIISKKSKKKVIKNE